MHTVGEVARLTGVSVRTLHHYEQVGLVTPQRGAANGYRLYDDSQLTRLRDVLLYRGFGFSLERIAEVLDNNTDPRTTLLEQQSLLSQQIRRLQDMQAALKKEIDAMDNGTPLTGAEKLEIFGADYDPAWEAEAEQRWGGTQAWQQSAERTKKLRKQDWIRIKQSRWRWGSISTGNATCSVCGPRQTAEMRVKVWVKMITELRNRGIFDA